MIELPLELQQKYDEVMREARAKYKNDEKGMMDYCEGLLDAYNIHRKSISTETVINEQEFERT